MKILYSSTKKVRKLTCVASLKCSRHWFSISLRWKPSFRQNHSKTRSCKHLSILPAHYFIVNQSYYSLSITQTLQTVKRLHQTHKRGKHKTGQKLPGCMFKNLFSRHFLDLVRTRASKTHFWREMIRQIQTRCYPRLKHKQCVLLCWCFWTAWHHYVVKREKIKNFVKIKK